MSRIAMSIRTAAVGLALTAALAAPFLAVAQEATPAPFEPSANAAELTGQIVSDGSSTVGPITQAVAEDFAAIAPNVQTSVDISGTGGGFQRFCGGETDVQNASRAIEAEEDAACAAAGVQYYVFEVALDGVTVVANPELAIDCLTVDQLKQLWAPDSTVANANELDPAFPDQALELFGPGTDSGTFDYFTGEIVGEEGASRTDYTPSEDDNVIVEGVAGSPGGIGYFGYAYYENNQDRLKAIAIDGGNGCIMPSPETIADGSYAPLSRPLYVYVNAASLDRPEVQEFMRFYLASAPTLVGEVGFVDAPTEVYVADQERLNADIAGEGAPDGPLATPAA